MTGTEVGEKVEPMMCRRWLRRSYSSEPVFEFLGGRAVLRVDVERGGERLRGGLRFGWACAFRFQADDHCTAWQVKDVYDTLAEVAGSGLVRELLTADPGERCGR